MIWQDLSAKIGAQFSIELKSGPQNSFQDIINCLHVYGMQLQ